MEHVPHSFHVHRLIFLVPDYYHEIAILDGANGYVAGCDEAGRGPLAGPVVAAAVILPVNTEIPGLDDSKTLTEKRREVLFEKIHECALAISVASQSAMTIDEVNIRQASLGAMRTSLAGLAITPSAALFDGRDIPVGLSANLRKQAIIGGDGRSMSIAAASIIAKVTRDRMLIVLDRQHAQYGFASHKGYGSAKQHQAAIKEHGGVRRVHRMSFAPFRQSELF
ncbi:MAG: ribonuclease HII [Pseudomonadota bacterium]